MILQFNKPISLCLKDELFQQAVDFREDKREYEKLIRLFTEVGWLQEYRTYERSFYASGKRGIVQGGI